MEEDKRMLMVTLTEIPGKKLEPLGVVSGAERGNRPGVTISIAMEEMEEQAAALGADAVIDVRIISHAVSESANSIHTVYGTAVKFVE